MFFVVKLADSQVLVGVRSVVREVRVVGEILSFGQKVVLSKFDVGMVGDLVFDCLLGVSGSEVTEASN